MDRAAASGAAGAGSNPARRVFLNSIWKEQIANIRIFVPLIF